MSQSVRVVVVDDHPVVREGLRMMLEEMAEGFELVGSLIHSGKAFRTAMKIYLW